MPAAGASKPKPVAKRPKRQTVPGQKPAQRAASAPPADEPPRAPRTPRSRPKPRAERLRQPPQPAGTPPTPRSRKPVPATGADIIGTAVQAAAELAEIGLTVSARALRNAVARLPKP
jgi:hypothetical protein